MKKIISVILAICMCVVLLVGCGDSTSESETSGSVTSEIATSENTTNETVTSETVTSETVTNETATSETPTAMEEEPTEPEILFSSFCGDDLDWTLDSAGTLTISGTGEMDDYMGPGDEPWTDFLDDIETIIVESGVTSIGSYAFASCSNITSIILPDSINRLGEGFLDKSGELIENFEIPSNVT